MQDHMFTQRGGAKLKILEALMKTVGKQAWFMLQCYKKLPFATLGMEFATSSHL